MSEDTLPNCLTKVPQADRYLCQPGIWFYLFCANCGSQSPYRVRDTELPAQFAFYLCNDCVDKWGEPAGVTKTPDDVWMAKVRAAQMEDYGRTLTEAEILTELEDSSSVISKLEKEGRNR